MSQPWMCPSTFCDGFLCLLCHWQSPSCPNISFEQYRAAASTLCFIFVLLFTCILPLLWMFSAFIVEILKVVLCKTDILQPVLDCPAALVQLIQHSIRGSPPVNSYTPLQLMHPTNASNHWTIITLDDWAAGLLDNWTNQCQGLLGLVQHSKNCQTTPTQHSNWCISNNTFRLLDYGAGYKYWPDYWAKH